MADYDVTRVAGNIGASNALNALMNINKQLATYQARLATGKRINTAADDPAGLTIATKMLSRSEGLKTALNNIGDAKNLLAVAESGLGRINDILIQMRNKSEAAASDTMGTDERDAIHTQLIAFAAQVDDIVEQTKWNGNKLINGTYNVTALSFQTGADSTDTTTLNGLTDVHAAALGIVTTAAASSTSGSYDAAGLTLATSGVRGTTADGTGASVFAGSGAGMTELASGNYKVRVHIGGSGVAGASYVQLFDANGNSILTDADGVDGGSLDTKTTFTYTNAAASTVKLGNGLNVVIGDGASTLVGGDHVVQDFTYTKAGSSVISANSAGTYGDYMTTLESAMSTVNGQLSKIGALTGRLTFKEDQVSAAQINVESAYNRIMNANMAEEQVNASKFSILQQTATAMLSQANAAPQFLLSLFR